MVLRMENPTISSLGLPKKSQYWSLMSVTMPSLSTTMKPSSVMRRISSKMYL